MIALIKMEFYKLWHHKRFLTLLLLCLLGNLCYLVYDTYLQPTYPPQSYQQLQKDLHPLSSSERIDYLTTYKQRLEMLNVQEKIAHLKLQNDPQAQMQIDALLSQYPDFAEQAYKGSKFYTGTLEQELAFITHLQQQAATVQEYPMFLEQIQEKAKTIQTISIFGKEDSFSLKNIVKSAQDYTKMKKVTIDFQIQDPLVNAINSPITNLLLLLMIFFSAGLVLLEEKEKQLLFLVRITPRNPRIAPAKYIVLLASCMILPPCFYLCNFICLYGAYGGIDLQASLQSLACFQQSTLSQSIGQFLCLFLGLKIMICTIIASFVLLLCIVCRHKVLCFLSIGILGMSNLFAFLLISPSGSLRILHYLNLASMYELLPALTTYVNFNFLGHPVSLLALFLLLTLFFLVISYFLLILSFHHLSIASSALSHFHIKKRKLFPLTKSLFLQECYKYFWMQKVFFLLLFCFLFQLQSYTSSNIYSSQEERTWIAYLQPLKGKVTEEKAAFLKQEEANFTKLHEQEAVYQKQLAEKKINQQQYLALITPISTALQKEAVFQELQAYYAYVSQDEHRQIIPPFAYRHYYLNGAHWKALPLFFLFLLCISNLHCMEYGQNQQVLLLSSVHGKKVFYAYKSRLMIFTGVFLLVCFAFPDFLSIHTTYGFSYPFAAITSLQEFSILPNTMMVSHFFLLSFLIKCFALVPVLVFCRYCAIKSKQQLFTLLLSSLCFLLPIGLSLAGISLFEPISILPLIYNAPYFTSSSSLWILAGNIVFYLVFTLFFLYRTKRK